MSREHKYPEWYKVVYLYVESRQTGSTVQGRAHTRGTRQKHGSRVGILTVKSHPRTRPTENGTRHIKNLGLNH